MKRNNGRRNLKFPVYQEPPHPRYQCCCNDMEPFKRLHVERMCSPTLKSGAWRVYGAGIFKFRSHHYSVNHNHYTCFPYARVLTHPVLRDTLYKSSLQFFHYCILGRLGTLKSVYGTWGACLGPSHLRACRLARACFVKLTSVG